MKRIADDQPIQLAGFNNLTKALSFNLYDFCAARNEKERQAYREYVARNFSAKRISEVLTGICDIIEAEVLAISDQDYDPWGASSLVLMSDLKGSGVGANRNSEARHLDKSHICAHTYPDFNEDGSICTFRVDIDIATCGEISPLKALNYMFEKFENDVVVVDYVVRGFTRSADGKRVYMDHALRSIQDYISPDILKDYHCVDIALQSDNIWQTKLLRVNLNEGSYFFNDDPMDEEERQGRINDIKREMRGVVHMWPE